MINSTIDEVKSRLDIVEVISNYVKLIKAGRNYKALCPFHNEKTPSFMVSPERQIWHCFGCNESGDIFTFVMKMEGIEFGDALRMLAQKAGVELKRQDPKLQTQRQQISQIYQLATIFFEEQLASKNNQIVKEYLLKRGISQDSIKQWRIGYAPNTWRALSDFLISKGYKPQEVEKAGLTIKKELLSTVPEGQAYGAGNSQMSNVTYYDRFRSRIMFPITDVNGNIIGFGGRIFGPQEKKDIAKYINTPQTLVYDKSSILYGLSEAKLAIRKTNLCILVEGYTDVILSHQAGVKNVVAVSGTALTDKQINLIKRYSSNIALCFDMDTGGQAATERSVELAMTKGLTVKAIILPQGKDPADIVLENPKLWTQLAKAPKDIMEFYFAAAFENFDPGNLETKKSIADKLLGAIKRIPNKIEQAEWLDKLATKLAVDVKVLADQMALLKNFNASEKKFSSVKEPPTKNVIFISSGERIAEFEKRLLGILLMDFKNLGILESQEDSLFSETPLVQIFDGFKNIVNKTNKILDPEVIIEKLRNNLEPNLQSYLDILILKIENLYNFDVQNRSQIILQELKFCLRQLKEAKLRSQLVNLASDIKKAEELGDSESRMLFIKEFNRISEKLGKL